MGIFSTIGNLGLGDFDESKILDNDSGAAARRGEAEQKETKLSLIHISEPTRH